MLIRNGLVFTGEGKFAQLDVVTDGDLIGALLPPGTADTTNQTVVDATGCYVIPGLTDIHFHGCDGFDFCDDSLASCAAFVKQLLRFVTNNTSTLHWNRLT